MDTLTGLSFEKKILNLNLDNILLSLEKLIIIIIFWLIAKVEPVLNDNQQNNCVHKKNIFYLFLI